MFLTESSVVWINSQISIPPMPKCVHFRIDSHLKMYIYIHIHIYPQPHFTPPRKNQRWKLPRHVQDLCPTSWQELFLLPSVLELQLHKCTRMTPSTHTYTHMCMHTHTVMGCMAMMVEKKSRGKLCRHKGKTVNMPQNCYCGLFGKEAEFRGAWFRSWSII